MERSLEQIRKDLRFISSNKLSPDQSILMFIGLTLEIVLRKDLFKRNIDLKGFVEDMYISKTEEKELFMDYIYASRPLLTAKLNILILNELNYSKVISICKNIEGILPEEIITKKSNNSSIQDDAVSEWMNFIGKRK